MYFQKKDNSFTYDQIDRCDKKIKNIVLLKDKCNNINKIIGIVIFNLLGHFSIIDTQNKVTLHLKHALLTMAIIIVTTKDSLIYDLLAHEKIHLDTLLRTLHSINAAILCIEQKPPVQKHGFYIYYLKHDSHIC